MFYCTLIPDSYSHWACPSLSMAEQDNAWWNPYLDLGSRLFSEILAQISSHCVNYPLTQKNGKIQSSFTAPYVQMWTRLSLFLKILSSYMSVQTVSFSFQGLTKVPERIWFSAAPPDYCLLCTTGHSLLLSLASHVLLLSKYAYAFSNKNIWNQVSPPITFQRLNILKNYLVILYLLGEWPCCSGNTLQAILIFCLGLLVVHCLTHSSK